MSHSLADISCDLADLATCRYIFTKRLSLDGDNRFSFCGSRNPVAFYFAAAQNDWTSPQNGELWRDEIKTLFDPCPNGWRLPKSGTTTDIPNPSPWKAFNMDNSVLDISGGRVFNTVVHGAAGKTWYPAAGYRHWLNGNFNLVTVELSCMSSTSTNGVIYYLYSTASTVKPSGFNDGGGWPAPAIGFPVRCVRE